MEYVTIFLALFLVILAWFSRRRSRRLNLPPGPPALPIIGNALQLNPAETHISFTNLSREYGPVFRAYLFNQLVVVLNTKEAITECFLRQKENFSDRPESVSNTAFIPGCVPATFQPIGQQYRIHRRIFREGLNFFVTQEADYLDQIIIEEAELLTKTIDEENILHSFTLTSLRIMNRLAFNNRDAELEKDIEVQMDFEDHVEPWMTFATIMDCFPFMKPLLYFSVQKFHRSFRNMCDRYKNHVKAHDAEPTTTPTFTTKMIRVMNELDHEFTTAERAGLISEFLLPSTQTTSVSIAWIALYLAENQHCQEKVYQELKNIDVSHKDLSGTDLPYTKAVLHEVSRIASVAPMGLPHCVRENCKYQDWDIPKGTVVFANMYALHHDPNLWSEPEIFKPERFLDSEGNLDPSKTKRIMPFGCGLRRCSGQRIANIIIFLLMAKLIQNFKLSRKNPEVPINLEGHTIIARYPKEKRLRFQPRK